MKKLVLLCVVLCLVGVAKADSVDLYAGDGWGTAVEDAMLMRGDPDGNYGAGTEVYVGYEGNNLVFKFDVSPIPVGSTIDSAQLNLNCSWALDPTFGVVYYAADLLVPWVESEATWNERSTGVAWDSAGAYGAGDYGTIMSGVTVTGPDSYVWDVTAAVQNWIDGSAANNGLALLYGDGWGYQPKSIYSSEAGVGRGGPTLMVYYTVPEPMTMTLLGIGGLLGVLRRKAA